MRSADLKDALRKNATEIVRLLKFVHETFRQRDRDAESREVWRRACADFQARYDALAFPGGYTGAAARILAGEAGALEAALCFLELRPYFFRSGYMYSALMRKVKRATLEPHQADRLRTVLERDAAWRVAKGRRDVA